jgi:hypothetical protein
MPLDISPFLANEIDRQRREAFRLFAAAPLPVHRAAIKQILRQLDVLPTIVSESFLLQALFEPASLLRELDRAIHRRPGPVPEPVAFRRLRRTRRATHLDPVGPPNTPGPP